MATFANRLLHQSVQTVQLCLNKLQHMIYKVNIIEEIHGAYNRNHITALLKALVEAVIVYLC